MVLQMDQEVNVPSTPWKGITTWRQSGDVSSILVLGKLQANRHSHPRHRPIRTETISRTRRTESHYVRSGISTLMYTDEVPSCSWGRATLFAIAGQIGKGRAADGRSWRGSQESFGLGRGDGNGCHRCLLQPRRHYGRITTTCNADAKTVETAVTAFKAENPSSLPTPRLLTRLTRISGTGN
jgi:hypothetical protein